MKRFIFKLENVLHYRVTLETLAKSAYQEALRVLNIEKNTLENFMTARLELMKSYDIKAGTVVYAETLMFLARYTVQLANLIEQQKKIVLEKEAIAREKFQEWNKRRMDVKVITKLKEKRWKEYLKEIDKEDQKFQDEIFIAKKIKIAKGEI
jgi:flagellar protein FliJ